MKNGFFGKTGYSILASEFFKKLLDNTGIKAII